MGWDCKDSNVRNGLGKGAEGIFLAGIFIFLKRYRLLVISSMSMIMFVTVNMTARIISYTIITSLIDLTMKIAYYNRRINRDIDSEKDPCQNPVK